MDKTDLIKEIKIDDSGRLCIYPQKEQFTLIYRSAAEVHWDSNDFFLFSPTPREWTYFDWYKQIIIIVKFEYGFDLLVTTDTIYNNIPFWLKQDIMNGFTFT